MEKKEDRLPTDEELLERHRKARTRRRRRIVITVAVVVILVLAVVAFAVTRIRRGISERIGAGSGEAAQSAEVTRGSIRTTVSGSGILTNGDEEEVEMPASLVLDEYLVEEGDSVSAGEVIATVTSDSLLSALSDTQAELDRLDEEIEEAEDDKVDDTITASVDGRVKKIWAQSGDEVASVMTEDGALLLLSLDGTMAVDVEAGDLAADDEVTVTDSTGESWEGTVETVREGTAVILITDRGPALEEEVVVTDEDGQTVGRGSLYIHRSLAVTGYAGTVKKVQVSENSLVEAGDTLFTLEDTSVTSRRDALLEEREETEQTLRDLIAIQEQGGVCAGSDGEIVSLSDGTSEYSLTLTAAQSSASSDETVRIASLTEEDTMVVTFDVDETDILSLAEGQEASVGIDSLGEETVEGTVTGIGSEAASASGVTTYAAEVTIAKAEGMLAGMTASVDIEIEGVEDALLIPADALQETSTTAYVYTQYDEESGELSGMTEVTAGLRNSSYVEITAGLSEGDTVYYSASAESAGFGGLPFGGMGGMGGMGGDASDRNGADGAFGQGGGMGGAGREGMPDASAVRPGSSDGN